MNIHPGLNRNRSDLRSLHFNCGPRSRALHVLVRVITPGHAFDDESYVK